MKKIKLGIIGFGMQGSAYVDFLIEEKVHNMELGAISDIDVTKKEDAHRKQPNIPFFCDYIDMIESRKVDAVVITVPHYLHPAIGIEALKRKMPVICEKPAGVYTKQVRELNEVAKKNPEIPFAIMFNQRSNPLYIKIKNLIDDNVLGEIRRTNWIITTWWRPQIYYSQNLWRATWGAEGGGVLVNQAPHQLDLLQWICGKPKKVFADVQFGSHRNIAVEDEVTAFFKYENGSTGVFITCTHDAIGTDRFEILGDKGKIVIEDSKRASVKILKEPEPEMNKNYTLEQVTQLVRGNIMGKCYDEYIIESQFTWENQLCKVLENFAAHIIDKKPLLAPGYEGINGVQLANAILLSGWLQKEVDCNFDENLFVEELNKQIEKEGKYKTIGI
jgi:UDP-N-acetyl-2-amino-2-deoxyglucuronate dehydrogenase